MLINNMSTEICAKQKILSHNVLTRTRLKQLPTSRRVFFVYSKTQKSHFNQLKNQMLKQNSLEAVSFDLCACVSYLMFLNRTEDLESNQPQGVWKRSKNATTISSRLSSYYIKLLYVTYKGLSLPLHLNNLSR